jgi:hypothetical protein
MKEKQVYQLNDRTLKYQTLAQTKRLPISWIAWRIQNQTAPGNCISKYGFWQGR